ncbi:MAG: FAD-dependent oxidoreductase, partial [Oleibacter sp.]|nr:FAD-dependent oxidoreductase [Thalassolituus sp.]
GYAALFSPETGIIDSHTFMRCLAQQSEQQGALVMKRTQFIQATLSTQGSNQVWSVRLNTDSGPYEISTRFVINAAGLYSHKVAMACGANAHEIPPVYYCRGHYFNYQARSPFQHLVYPLPDEQLAGLGIHATLDLNNQCRFGPDAEYLSANIIDYKMNDSHRDQFIDAIRRYFPDLRPEKLEVGYAGIRPKLSAQGEPAEDFQVIEQSAPSGQICGLHLYGIESPGLTSSLALAELIQERVRFSTFL